MKLLALALWREVRLRRPQFAAIAMTVLLGVALFGASFDAFQNLTTSYQRVYDDLRFADLTITGGSVDAAADIVADQPDVEAVTTRTVADIPIEVGTHRFLGRVVGLPADGQPAVNRVLVQRGTYLDPGRPAGVLVEQHMAANFGLEPGDSLAVLGATGWRTAEVLGVVASPEYLWPARSRQEILVPPDQFGVVFAAEKFAAASPAGSTQREALVDVVADASGAALSQLSNVAIGAGATGTMTRAEQPSNAALQEDVAGFGELSLAFPLLFLGAGALAMSILLGRIVAIHRGQIGMLRALGFRRRTILLPYLGLGVLVGLGGAIPGAALGAVAGSAISSVYTGVLSIPITVVEVRPVTVLAGLMIGPLAGVLAAIVPARRAASTPPAEAMRGAAPLGRGSVSLLERLLPALARLPARWRIALRGPGRNLRRTGATIVGIALATSLIFVSWAMIDTVQILLDRQFIEVQRQDAQVALVAPVPASQVADSLDVDGVAATEPVVQLPVAIVAGSARYSTTLVGLPIGTTMRAFLSPGGEPTRLGDGVLLGAALRDILDVEVGDRVAVEPAQGVVGGATDPTPQLIVDGFVSEPLGTFAYASLPTAAGVAGLDEADPQVGSALVRYADGADRQSVRERLGALSAVAAVVDSRALYDTAQSFMALFYAFVLVMLGLGGVMAFALVFNTLSANVTERAVELTALRALGMASRTIGRLVTVENVLLTVVALVPGLVVAYAMAAAFMASFSSDLFRFDLEVRPTTIMGTAVVIILVALVSQWPALRAIRRLELARIVRERAS